MVFLISLLTGCSVARAPECRYGDKRVTVWQWSSAGHLETSSHTHKHCKVSNFSPSLQEIAAYLITFEKHEEWLTTSPKTRPQNGSMILYNRKKVKYRKDGYCWKKRKDGKTTREDHMKLKVQGVEVSTHMHSYTCSALREYPYPLTFSLPSTHSTP
ncbi:unnamed protein product [Oncorhynchus mykiss]|uniref:CG-1 domain-containing protein n=1 Tax=Oncorhynchus mykiss TaxID=8022 RepID=A0A060XME2_ONCMY|nr:unnamed protein product [Oncorhynchus mykiss]